MKRIVLLALVGIFCQCAFSQNLADRLCYQTEVAVGFPLLESHGTPMRLCQKVMLAQASVDTTRRSFRCLPTCSGTWRVLGSSLRLLRLVWDIRSPLRRQPRAEATSGLASEHHSAFPTRGASALP